MLRHALVPRVSASLHRLALTYNLKPVVDPLLLQNLPPRGRSGPYPIPSGSNGAAAASLTGFSYPIAAVFSTAARRRIRNDAYLNFSPTHPHRAGAQGFRRHRFSASFLALDSPAGYRLVFSLLCSNKNILRALVRCTPSTNIQILFVSELLHGVSLYLYTG